MSNYRFYISYKVDGVLYGTEKERCVHYYIDKNISDDAIKITIHPKVDMELVKMYIYTDREFAENEKFYCNGYQAWTPSREYTANDVHKKLASIYKWLPLANKLMTPPGDVNWWPEDEGKGNFHGYTYTYFKKGDNFELIGSLSDRFAYTIYNAKMNDKLFYIYKEVEGKTIEGGKPVLAYDLIIRKGGYDEVFDAYFKALNLPACRIDHMSGYTSWYNYFRNIDKETMLRDLDGLDRAKDEVSIFQIDDGYQITTGDWTTNEKFPEGLRPITDKIHEKGYQAGLWIAPFNASKKSSIFKNHKDWLIHKDNKPLFSVFNVDGGWYTLDIYNEEVREHIRGIFKRALDEWNFDMVKLDFLYSQAMFPRNNKTRSEIMYDAIEFLRECVGDKLILGCGVPLAPCFGVVDACRIGCDVSPNYKGGIINDTRFSQEIVNAQNAITNSMFRRHLNGKAFVNDPDVFFLRDIKIKYTEEQKKLLGFINNLFGDVLFVSDNVGDFSDEKIALLKKFFKKNTQKVYSVDKVSDAGDYEVVFGNDSTKHTLKFNLHTGVSNVEDFLNL